LPKIKASNSKLRGINQSLDASTVRNLGKLLGNDTSRASVSINNPQGALSHDQTSIGKVRYGVGSRRRANMKIVSLPNVSI
jgi:hypothetical protein